MPLAALTTDAGGSTVINTAAISAGTVTLNDNVTLSSTVVVTGTTSVALNANVTGGGNDLTINSPLTTLGDAAGDSLTGLGTVDHGRGRHHDDQRRDGQRGHADLPRHRGVGQQRRADRHGGGHVRTAT